jgi:hypothetical protein
MSVGKMGIMLQEDSVGGSEMKCMMMLKMTMMMVLGNYFLFQGLQWELELRPFPHISHHNQPGMYSVQENHERWCCYITVDPATPAP